MRRLLRFTPVALLGAATLLCAQQAPVVLSFAILVLLYIRSVKILVPVVAAMSSFAATAQAQTSLAPTVIVAREREPRRFSEPHLVVHPANPNHLLAVAWSALTSDEPEVLRCHSFVSTDSGTTWSRHDFKIESCYDAQVAILPDGRAVLVALGHVPDIRPDR